MSPSMQVEAIGIPWYRREDYPAILRIMKDWRNLPLTFDQWEKQADAAEAQFKGRGKVVYRAYIDPKTFPAWCAKNGRDVDSQGRTLFAANPGNWHGDS